MPVYYPSIVVNLRVRFDETLNINEPIPSPQPADGSDVDVLSGADAPVRLTQPLVVNRGEFQLSQILNRVPKSASIEMPGVRTAGKFTLALDYRELPIDPRIVRAAAIDIHQGTVDPDDFSTGMVQTMPDGRRRSVLNIDGRVPDMTGLVDNWRIVHNDTSSMVMMDGRDLRGVLLDSPFDQKRLGEVDLTRSIDVVVEDILKNHPIHRLANKGFFIKAESDEWPTGVIPSPGDRKTISRIARGAGGQKSMAGPNSSKVNYWDAITFFCNRVGAIAYFSGPILRIRPARTVYSQISPQSASRSPFRPNGRAGVPGARQDDNNQDFYVRKMIYGRNISELSFERKYTGAKARVIEVSSLDHSSGDRGVGKLRVARWPTKDKTAANVTGVLPGGEASQTDVQRFSYPGISSDAALLEIAKNLYEEIGKQELGGACQTKNLASFKGGNSDPDLLSMKPGDAVEFAVDIRQLGSQSPLVSEYTDANRGGFSERVAALKQSLSGKALAADDNLIRAVIATARSSVIDRLNFFRVSNIKYTWSNGVVSIAFDFHNFQIIRAQVAAQLSEPTTTPQPSTGRRSRRRKEKQQPSNERVLVRTSRSDRRLVRTSRSVAGEEAARAVEETFRGLFK